VGRRVRKERDLSGVAKGGWTSAMSRGARPRRSFTRRREKGGSVGGGGEGPGEGRKIRENLNKQTRCRQVRKSPAAGKVQLEEELWKKERKKKSTIKRGPLRVGEKCTSELEMSEGGRASERKKGKVLGNSKKKEKDTLVPRNPRHAARGRLLKISEKTKVRVRFHGERPGVENQKEKEASNDWNSVAVSEGGGGRTIGRIG